MVNVPHLIISIPYVRSDLHSIFKRQIPYVRSTVCLTRGPQPFQIEFSTQRALVFLLSIYSTLSFI
jgi:hypothetical protein